MAEWRVKYDGLCSNCGKPLRAGDAAVWDRRVRKMFCLDCIAKRGSPSPNRVAPGTAGRSARHEYERLQQRRETQLKDRWGQRLGGLINRFADEPQTIRAWGLGARGEELLGAELAKVPELLVLNDRRVRATRGNIDHILIAPAGVFVVDAKHYEGTIEVVDVGGLFRTDRRLKVGGRDKSELAEKMEWQVKAVIRAMADADITPLPPTQPVLCFVDGNWPLFRAPKSYNGVLLESERSLVARLNESAALEPDAIDRIARCLSEALPPK